MILPKVISVATLWGDGSKLYLADSNAETLVPGVTSITVDNQRDSVDATTLDDGGFKKTLPSTRSCQIKIEMLVIDGDATQALFFAAHNTDNVVLPVKAYEKANGACTSGDFIVSDISHSHSKGELQSLSITLDSFGEFSRVAATGD